VAHPGPNPGGELGQGGKPHTGLRACRAGVMPAECPPRACTALRGDAAELRFPGGLPQGIPLRVPLTTVQCLDVEHFPLGVPGWRPRLRTLPFQSVDSTDV